MRPSGDVWAALGALFLEDSSVRAVGGAIDLEDYAVRAFWGAIFLEDYSARIAASQAIDPSNSVQSASPSQATNHFNSVQSKTNKARPFSIFSHFAKGGSETAPEAHFDFGFARFWPKAPPAEK